MSQKQLVQGKSYTRKKIQNFSYGLNDAIGKGYSSQVYKGRNDNTEEPVAVKVIDLKMLKCEINRTLLASEIDILKSMKNVPHILTLHEVYTTKNNTYIITELCESDLSRKIKKGLSESQVFTYMNQFLLGYKQIHEQQLIHRDLKPANLLLTHNNSLKIADFGFGIKAEEVLKPSKYNVGSPLYMAPESLKRNEYSFKTDIWAIGVIFFQMLTGDTPWRAKNQKDLIKKIEGQKIESILTRHNFASITKQFLLRALCQDKHSRMGPEQMLQYTFTNETPRSNVLGEKQMNNMKLQKFQSIINDIHSPKGLNNVGRSVEKRIFQHDRSDKKLPTKGMNSTQNLQNISLKNIENLDKKVVASPQKHVNVNNSVNHNTILNQNTSANQNATTGAICKEDRKYISKLLIAEVHFCRFLYKLLGRVKESSTDGIFRHNPTISTMLFTAFTQIIEHKVTKLKEFDQSNYLKEEVDYSKYTQYKQTSDFKKLVKIARDYYDRYSSELKTFWQNRSVKMLQNNSKANHIYYRDAIDEVVKAIEYLLSSLQENPEQLDGQEFLKQNSKDIVILDYLITCKQLLEMIERDIKNNGIQNYDRFAKKSRIQEIVEGSTSDINAQLYGKIIERGRMVINI